ncbi:MAG TPA: peptidoglycan DD-metalloendopeptidase family protein [Burkholderiales bacterium]|nr:peptidoglycan DD-metalloendopeptidase family protein [Burkholderiales bacterium]
MIAQKRGAAPGKTALWRLPVLLLLPFLGVVAAFGIAPDTVTDAVTRTPVAIEVALPAPQPAAVAPAGYWREERIQRGDTLAELLARLGAEDPQAVEYLRSARAARPLAQLVPGRTVRAQLDAQGRLLALRYRSGTTLLTIERAGDAFGAREAPVEFERRVLASSGEIRSSLFAATDAAGLPDAVAIQIADIFATDIDFHRDLRRGDRFGVVYEMDYDQGEPVRVGRVLAAEFTNQGKTYRAVYFQSAGGQGGYYTPEGRNIRKAFLRSPLEFSRITSGFTSARFHPILQQWRAHKGIDYGAPVGTRVRATGDGIVEFAGRQGAYGNLVVLRHQSKYTTWYAHLSGFARGIRKGARVAQGQVIGYVGATGLATGPHLHYEFRINDVHQDPLRVVLPSAPPIGAGERPAFEAATAPLAHQLALLRHTLVARLD